MLESMELTNGEAGGCTLLMGFMAWMKSNKYSVPESGKDLDLLLSRWVAFTRIADMQRLYDEGKITKRLWII